MNGLRKRSKQNERLKLICMAIETFLVECGGSLPVRNGREMVNIFFEDEETPTPIIDGFYDCWTIYEINNDDRFPRYLRAANRFYKYGVVSDNEVREAAERMAAAGVLATYEFYSEILSSTQKYYEYIDRPVREMLSGPPENAPLRFVMYRYK